MTFAVSLPLFVYLCLTLQGQHLQVLFGEGQRPLILVPNDVNKLSQALFRAP